MSGKLIERLRARETLCHMSGGRTVAVPDILCNEAAEEITRLRAELSSLRGEGEGEQVKALAGYRAAVSFISACSWDGCPDCINILKAARAADWTHDQHHPDVIAGNLKRIRLHYSPADAPFPAPDSDVIGRLAGALAKRDECVKACPVNSKNWRGGSKACPSCGAGTGQDCPVIVSADYALMMDLRQALAFIPTPDDKP